ncbi:MAG TPA: hypothetical protein PKY26_05235 [Acetivibrio clariflavus]|nr:hypothetical protein [Acetivibrio clariflavus]
MVKYMCINCNRLGSPDKPCTCGGIGFVAGKNFYCIDGKIFCGCGNSFFARKTTISNKEEYKKIYECSSCKEIVEIHHYWKLAGRKTY